MIEVKLLQQGPGSRNRGKQRLSRAAIAEVKEVAETNSISRSKTAAAETKEISDTIMLKQSDSGSNMTKDEQK